MLPKLKPLEAQWKESKNMQVETIKKINKFDQENYWNFLIKPYHQCLTLQPLSDSTNKSLPALSNAVFKAISNPGLHSQLS